MSSKELDAVNYLFEIYKVYSGETKEDEKWFDAIVTVKKEIEKRQARKDAIVVLVGKLMHYSEQYGIAQNGKDDTLKSIMGAKQQALLEVIMEILL